MNQKFENEIPPEVDNISDVALILLGSGCISINRQFNKRFDSILVKSLQSKVSVVLYTLYVIGALRLSDRVESSKDSGAETENHEEEGENKNLVFWEGLPPYVGMLRLLPLQQRIVRLQRMLVIKYATVRAYIKSQLALRYIIQRNHVLQNIQLQNTLHSPVSGPSSRSATPMSTSISVDRKVTIAPTDPKPNTSNANTTTTPSTSASASATVPLTDPSQVRFSLPFVLTIAPPSTTLRLQFEPATGREAVLQASRAVRVYGYKRLLRCLGLLRGDSPKEEEALSETLPPRFRKFFRSSKEVYLPLSKKQYPQLSALYNHTLALYYFRQLQYLTPDSDFSLVETKMGRAIGQKGNRIADLEEGEDEEEDSRDFDSATGVKNAKKDSMKEPKAGESTVGPLVVNATSSETSAAATSPENTAEPGFHFSPIKLDTWQLKHVANLFHTKSLFRTMLKEAYMTDAADVRERKEEPDLCMDLVDAHELPLISLIGRYIFEDLVQNGATNTENADNKDKEGEDKAPLVENESMDRNSRIGSDAKSKGEEDQSHKVASLNSLLNSMVLRPISAAQLKERVDYWFDLVAALSDGMENNGDQDGASSVSQSKNIGRVEGLGHNQTHNQRISSIQYVLGIMHRNAEANAHHQDEMSHLFHLFTQDTASAEEKKRMVEQMRILGLSSEKGRLKNAGEYYYSEGLRWWVVYFLYVFSASCLLIPSVLENVLQSALLRLTDSDKVARPTFAQHLSKEMAAALPKALVYTYYRRIFYHQSVLPHDIYAVSMNMMEAPSQISPSLSSNISSSFADDKRTSLIEGARDSRSSGQRLMQTKTVLYTTLRYAIEMHLAPGGCLCSEWPDPASALPNANANSTTMTTVRGPLIDTGPVEISHSPSCVNQAFLDVALAYSHSHSQTQFHSPFHASSASGGAGVARASESPLSPHSYRSLSQHSSPHPISSHQLTMTELRNRGFGFPTFSSTLRSATVNDDDEGEEENVHNVNPQAAAELVSLRKALLHLAQGIMEWKTKQEGHAVDDSSAYQQGTVKSTFGMDRVLVHEIDAALANSTEHLHTSFYNALYLYQTQYLHQDMQALTGMGCAFASGPFLDRAAADRSSHTSNAAFDALEFPLSSATSPPPIQRFVSPVIPLPHAAPMTPVRSKTSPASNFQSAAPRSYTPTSKPAAVLPEGYAAARDQSSEAQPPTLLPSSSSSETANAIANIVQMHASFANPAAIAATATATAIVNLAPFPGGTNAPHQGLVPPPLHPSVHPSLHSPFPVPLQPPLDRLHMSPRNTSPFGVLRASPIIYPGGMVYSRTASPSSPTIHVTRAVAHSRTKRDGQMPGVTVSAGRNVRISGARGARRSSKSTPEPEHRTEYPESDASADGN